MEGNLPNGQSGTLADRQTIDLLTQLRGLCEAHPLARKVVFVPKSQIGQALATASARRQGSWAGLQCQIPRHYAQDLVKWHFRKEGRRELSPADLPFFVADLVDSLPSDALPEHLPAPQHVARTVARAIETLRSHGIRPRRVQKRASADESESVLGLVATCYEHYKTALEEQSLFDDADVLEKATSLVERGDVPEIAETVFAVTDATELPNLTCRFLNALKAKGARFYRLGAEEHQNPPPHTAAAFFRDLPVPQQSSGDGETVSGRQIKTWRAVGVESEVDGVLREILDGDIPLDEVEIAYARSNPYLSLLANRAEQLDIPLNFTTGLPATQTLTGQALRGFYEWIEENFDAAVLIRLLRSGLLQVDRVLKDADLSAGAPEIATFLASRSYEPGREGYAKAFDFTRREIKNTMKRAAKVGVPADREQAQLQVLKAAEKVVEELLELAPRESTIAKMAAKSRQFIERFGPIEAAAEEAEDRSTFEQAARGVIYQKLDALAHTPVQFSAGSARLAGMLDDAIEKQFVRSQRPSEGAASVVPLESAGYAGRQHLFVLGMDGETLSWPAMDDVMLRDADLEAMGEDLDIQIQESQNLADESMWRIEQALRRHRGNLQLYASVFDIESNEARFPAALFLDVEEDAASENGKIGLGGRGDERILLDEQAAWLDARLQSRTAQAGAETSASDLHQTLYPHLSDGERARKAMHSAGWTEHDGLLAEGDYPELDFVKQGRVMSANRLETLASTPYVYFLKYVLGVEPLEEPALDDEAWLSNLRKGNILHRTFERFMRNLDGRSATLDDADALTSALNREIELEKQKVGPPNDRILATARRQLRADAEVFLRAEIATPEDISPRMHEVGFGYNELRRKDGDYDSVTVDFGDEISLRLRGRIDRVDEAEGEGLILWDYKTGSANDYSEHDPLQEGEHLQWALYAYVLDELAKEDVYQSGYFFTSVKEMGLRLKAKPALYREAVAELISKLTEMARTGSFPMHPKAHNKGMWKWRGYDAVFHDVKERVDALDAEDYPPERPRPPFMG